MIDAKWLLWNNEERQCTISHGKLQHVCVYMLYNALQSQWANLRHLDRGEDEGLDETKWRSVFSVLIAGYSTSGTQTEGSFERIVWLRGSEWHTYKDWHCTLLHKSLGTCHKVKTSGTFEDSGKALNLHMTGDLVLWKMIWLKFWWPPNISWASQQNKHCSILLSSWSSGNLFLNIKKTSHGSVQLTWRNPLSITQAADPKLIWKGFIYTPFQSQIFSNAAELKPLAHPLSIAVYKLVHTMIV